MDVRLLRPVRFEGKTYKAGEIIRNVGRSFREYLLKYKQRTKESVCVFGDAKDWVKPSEPEPETKVERKVKTKLKKERNRG